MSESQGKKVQLAQQKPTKSQQLKPHQIILIPKQKQSFFSRFRKFSKQRLSRLQITILGNYNYVPHNTFNPMFKQKIFSYLHAKYLTTLVAQPSSQKKFTYYQPPTSASPSSPSEPVPRQFPTYPSLRHLKQSYLSLSTKIQSAKQYLSQSRNTLNTLNGQYYNEIAFEFDKQRKISFIWFVLAGAILCSTLFRRTTEIRKIAVCMTMGLIGSQMAFRWNVDKYFDCVYQIFQKDAINFVEIEGVKERQNQLKKLVDGTKAHLKPGFAGEGGKGFLDL